MSQKKRCKNCEFWMGPLTPTSRERYRCRALSGASDRNAIILAYMADSVNYANHFYTIGNFFCPEHVRRTPEAQATPATSNNPVRQTITLDSVSDYARYDVDGPNEPADSETF